MLPLASLHLLLNRDKLASVYWCGLESRCWGRGCCGYLKLLWFYLKSIAEKVWKEGFTISNRTSNLKRQQLRMIYRYSIYVTKMFGIFPD